MIVNIITSIAIALIVLEIAIMNTKQKVDEEAIEEIEEVIEKKPSMVEIEEIISRLEAIAADIKRLDESTAQDHRDLVDIRERYILWRKPINWAGEYEEQESEERS